MNHTAPSFRLSLAIITVAIALSLSSCDDFFGTEDLKALIREDVALANADQIVFTIVANPTSGALLSLSGQQTRKIGETFSISATLFDAYVFGSWSSNGSVIFSNQASSTTTIKIIEAGTEALVITANLIARPRVKTVTPMKDWPEVLKNQPIVVNFNKEIDEASLLEAGRILITYDIINPSTPNPHTMLESGIASDYFDIAFTGTRLTFSPKSSAPNGGFMPSSSTITIWISAEIQDVDGNTMWDSEEWSIYTTDELYTDKPIIDSITILNGHDVSPVAKQFISEGQNCYAIKSDNVSLNISARTGSTSSNVQKLIIIEDGGTPQEFGYADRHNYTVQTGSIEGRKEITYYVINSTNTESDHETIYLYLDTTSPTLNLGTLSSNNTTNPGYAITGNTINLGINQTDSGSGLAADSTIATIAGEPASVSGTSCSYIVGAEAGEGSLTYSVTVTDHAGNSTTKSTGASGSVVVDKTPPTVSVTTSDNKTIGKSGDTITFTATFLDVNGIDETIAPTITVGSDTETMVPATNLVWTYVYDVPTGDANAAVSIAAHDVAGNSNASATGVANFIIDNTAPSVSISTNSGTSLGKGGDSVIFTATFTDTNGIDETTIPSIIIGGSTFNMTRYSNLVWTYLYTVPGGNEAYTVNIAAKDRARHDNSTPTGTTVYSVDNLGPAVVITKDHTDAIVRDADTVRITATFTELNGVSESPAPTISITGLVSAVTMQKTNNLEWYYEWNVPSANDGDVTVTVTAKDSAGNSNSTATGDITFTIDNTKPVVSFTAPGDLLLKSGETAVFIITTDNSQAMEDYVTSGDFSKVDASNVTVLSYDSTTNVTQLTVTANGSVSGTAVVTIAAGAITDVAGNQSDAVTLSTVTVDNTKPVVSFTAPGDLLLKSGETAVFTITTDNSQEMGDYVTSGDFSKVDASNVTVLSYDSTTNVTQLTVTANASVEGTSSVTIAAGAITDVAGNQSDAVTLSTVTVDNLGPAVVITKDHTDAIVRDADTVRITATFTELNGVSESPAPTISITGLVSAVTMQKTNNLEWYYEWNVPSANDGDVTVTVTAKDSAGNSNSTATGDITFTIDNTKPVVSFTAPGDLLLKSGETAVFTITTDNSQAMGDYVTSGDFSKVDASNVTVLSYDSTTNVTQLTVTANASVEGTSSVTIAAGAITDVAGNQSDAVTLSTITVDNTKPTITTSTATATAGASHPSLSVPTFSDAIGVVQVDYWIGDIARPGTVFSKSLPSTMTAGPLSGLVLDQIGNVSFSFQLVDGAGNLGGGGGANNYVYCAYESGYSAGVARSISTIINTGNRFTSSTMASTTSSQSTAISSASRSTTTSLVTPSATDPITSPGSWLTIGSVEGSAKASATIPSKVASSQGSESSQSKVSVASTTEAAAAQIMIPVKALAQSKDELKIDTSTAKTIGETQENSSVENDVVQVSYSSGMGVGSSGSSDSGTVPPNEPGMPKQDGSQKPFSVITPTVITGSRREEAEE